MKKVLMIAYNYPPLAGMGMLRSLKFAKYLPHFGWKPTILTVSTSAAKQIQSQYWLCAEAEGNLPGVEIIRSNFLPITSLRRYFFTTPTSSHQENASSPAINNTFSYKILRDFLSYIWNQWVLFPDGVIGWYPFAVKKAIDYIKTNNIDLIFSTSLPATTHIIASKISKKTGIPWVADFRDPWSQPHYKTTSNLRTQADKILQLRTLKSANALITVSEPLRQNLLKIHKQFVNKSYVIHNGYDSDDYLHQHQNKTHFFNIVFTGRMYDIDFKRTHRNPRLLFETLEELFKEAKLDPTKVRFNIYGEYPLQLREMISKFQLQGSVKCLDPVPFKESFILQQNATILLLLTWADSDYEGILTGKIFEYLGARKPILAIPFHNTGVSQILHDTKAGIIITNRAELKQQLYEWYQEFVHEGKVIYHGVQSEIEKFSRKRATKDLSQIFYNVSNTF
jgi:glycosyltransferase involved in cell wall biosynthesis